MCGYFNSIKVQLKPHDTIEGAREGANFYGVKVQLKLSYKKPSLTLAAISIP